MSDLPNAYIYEIFSGIQGEGLFVGERELFIRFCGCNLACSYCDTKYALDLVSTCFIEKKPGIREFEVRSNPLDVDELIESLSHFLNKKTLHHSIFLTGGEPLLWSNFLAVFLPQAKRSFNLPITLETNGTLPGELTNVLNWIDIVSMDYKLPSALGGKGYPKEHKEFLTLAKKKKVFIKFVITSSVGIEELEEAFRIVKDIGNFPIVLQPVSPLEDIKPPSETTLLNMQELGKEFFEIVRVIPQMHKFMGAR